VAVLGLVVSTDPKAVRIAAAALVIHGTADEAVPFSLPSAWPPRYRTANRSPFPIRPVSRVRSFLGKFAAYYPY
jgi:hypothetical protein